MLPIDCCESLIFVEMVLLNVQSKSSICSKAGAFAEYDYRLEFPTFLCLNRD